MKVKLLLPLLLLTSLQLRAQDPYTPSIKVDQLLRTSKDEAGRPVRYPGSSSPELAAYLVEIPPGQSTGWHIHQNPSLAHILQGVIDVDYEDGSHRQYKAGDTLAEVVEFKHNGINTGKVPVRILLFVAGEQGTPVSKRITPPK
jgi:quercetin dioxygenase-like cupin family protein